MSGALQTRVSVPGKLILLGEHAAVYGRPAVVASISLRLAVTMTSAVEGQGVYLSLPQIRLAEETDWPNLIAYAADARKRWEEFARNPDDGFAQVGIGDPGHLVKVALGEAAGVCEIDSLRDAHIQVDSEIPIGAGFGSSAAGAVALVSATLLHAGRSPGIDELESLALEVERRQHGFPSGVDHSAVLRGGAHWAVRRPKRPLRLERMAEGNPALSSVRVFHSGAPAESTGEVVAGVRAIREKDPVSFEATLDRIEFAARRFRRWVEATEADLPALMDCVREVEAALETLGVVPAGVREVVRKIEAEGGVAKISGAGSLAGPGAGCLLVVHEDPAVIDTWEFLDPWIGYPLRLGGEGLQTEQRA